MDTTGTVRDKTIRSGKDHAVPVSGMFQAPYNPASTRQRIILPIFLAIISLSGLMLLLFTDVFKLSQQANTWITASILAVIIIFLTIAIYQINTHILRPLSELKKWSKRLRAGDFVTPVPGETSNEEFSSLINDINLLTDELGSLTEEMDSKVSAQIGDIANKSRSLEILYDIATSLSESHNLDDLFDQFLDTLMTLVDAKAATVRLLTSDGNTTLVASRGLSNQVIKQESYVSLDRCLCGFIANKGGIGIQKGIDECNKYLDCPMLEEDCAELVVVPVQYQDRIIGVYNLFLDRPSSELGKDARDLLNSIGKHLGLALEKARLDENSRRLAVMEERNLLGSELHDSLAQSLVSMRLQTKMLGEILHNKDIRAAQNEVRNLRDAIEEAHASLRELLSNFRFKMDDRGLIHSLQELINNFRQETGINTYFQNKCDNRDNNISPAQEVQAFRIIQEALSNIRKHSNASNVRVMIFQDHGECNILIEDDGTGSGLERDGGLPGEHVGVTIMHERADRMDGSLSIESEPGEGTRVHLRFPTHPQNQPIQIIGE